MVKQSTFNMVSPSKVEGVSKRIGKRRKVEKENRKARGGITDGKETSIFWEKFLEHWINVKDQ